MRRLIGLPDLYFDAFCTFTGAIQADHGVSYDWERFFWDVDTQGETGGPHDAVPFRQIVASIVAANPQTWSKGGENLCQEPWPRLIGEPACPPGETLDSQAPAAPEVDAAIRYWGPIHGVDR